MPYISEHLYECPVTRKQHGTGLILPKEGRKKLVSAAEAMPLYSRAEIVAKLQAAGGVIALPDTGLPITNQTSHPLCWDWSMIQMVEYALYGVTGKAVRLDVSIAPVEDGCLNEGNDIHAAWTDGLEPYGVCPAAFMGTDPTAKTRPDMLRSQSQFPAGWQAEAAKRKGVERYECHDFLAMASAVLNNHPCVLGVDCDGGGHAIGCTTIILRSDGRLAMRTPGTWGGDYASGWAADPAHPGTYTLSEDQTGAAWGGYGCQAIVGVKDDEDAPTPAAS